MRTHYAGPETQGQTNNLDEIFRTEGFNEFLGKFEDAHNFDTSENNEAEIRRRYEIFKELPGLTQTFKDLAKQRNLELLGRTLTDQELNTIGTELENQITQKRNFQLFEILKGQAVLYKELPKEIQEWQGRLANIGSRETLEHQKTNTELRINAQEQRIKMKEESKEGVVLAKEGVKVAQRMEKNLGLAEQVFLRETETIVDNYQRSFGELERSQQRLLQADKESPKPGASYIPDLSSLRNNLEELKKHKKNPNDYIEALAGFGFAQRLEMAKKQLESACSGNVGELRKLAAKKREAEKYPNLAKSLEEFQAIGKDISKVNVDQHWDDQAQNLNTDLVQLTGVRQGLSYLENDPTNYRMLRQIENMAGDFSTTTGRNLAMGLRAGMEELSAIQNRLEDSSVSKAEVRQAVAYTSKGFMRRLFSKDPEAKAGRGVEEDKIQLENLENERDQLLAKLNSVSDAERELKQRQEQFNMNKSSLFRSLQAFDTVFKKSRRDSQDSVNKMLESDDLAKILSAKESLDKLSEAVTVDPELYGNADEVADYNPRFNFGYSHGLTLRDLQKTFAENLTAKVEKAVIKVLDSMDEKKINPDSLAAKLKKFEDGLGSVANSELYQQVRLQAFRRVVHAETGLKAGKKIALSRLLNEAARRGFVTEGNIDLKGLATAMAIPAPTTA